MGARNQVGIGLSYRPASLCSLAGQYQSRLYLLIRDQEFGLWLPLVQVQVFNINLAISVYVDWGG